MKLPGSIAGLAVLGGLAVHLSLLLVLRIELPEPPAPFPRQMEIHFIGDLHSGSDPLLQQQALLFDSAPLFMPTRWSAAGDLSGVASLQDATRVFSPFPPELRLPHARLPQVADSGTAGPEHALRLPAEPAFILAGVRHPPGSIPGADHSGPQLRALRLDRTGAGAPADLALPAALRSLAPGALWTPARFYLQLSGGFVAGEPVLSQSSGFSEWDQVLQDFIRSLDFHRLFSDGYFQVSVFP